MNVADAARALVERTRADQGLPLTISDPAALNRIAAIFASARNDRPKAAAPTRTVTATVATTEVDRV